MDKLREIITTFDQEYIREFHVFINRQKAKKERKDLKLFEILSEPKTYKSEEIVTILYDKVTKSKKAAYHALRKRLFEHITEFIVLKQMEDDPTTASSVMGLFSLVQYLFGKKSIQLGWKYLRKAEELAQTSEQYLLLNNIYLLQMEWSVHECADPFNVIEEKWIANKHQVRLEENAVVVLGLIRHKLKQQRLDGVDQHIERMIREILQKYDLDEAIFKRPKLLFTVLAILRSAYLGRRSNIELFEPYAIRQYDTVQANDGFSKHNHYYKLSILYMITHVLYRNFKFKEAEIYLEEFATVLEQYNRSHYTDFYPKFLMLKATIFAYTGRVAEAIELYEEGLKDKKNKLNTQDKLNILLNLSVVYFMQESYDEVLNVLNKMHHHTHTTKGHANKSHSDNFLAKKMGKEWLMKKNFLEVMAWCDLEDYNVALSRIRSIDRNFKEFFETQKVYKRAKIYLSYVKKYINQPSWLTKDVFHNEIVPGLGVQPGRKEDVQLIAYYSWLKSKAYNWGPYKALLDVINNTIVIEPSEERIEALERRIQPSKANTPITLSQEYLKIPHGLGKEKSELKDAWEKAYDAQKFEEALLEFHEILETDDVEDQHYFYAALSALYQKTKVPQNAIDWLDKVQCDSYGEDLDWYKSLAYILLEKNDEAKKILEHIEQSESEKRQEEVTKLLELI